MLHLKNESIPASVTRLENGTVSQGDARWAGEVNVPGNSTVIPYNDPVALQENRVMTPLPQTSNMMTYNGGSLNMKHNLSDEVIQSPVNRQEAYLGSLKAMLARNEGSYIVASFLVGTQGLVSWEGILYDVGNDYLTIYQEARNRYIVSDYYSLKFMEFYDTERQARCAELLADEGWRSNGQ